MYALLHFFKKRTEWCHVACTSGYACMARARDGSVRVRPRSPARARVRARGWTTHCIRVHAPRGRRLEVARHGTVLRLAAAADSRLFTFRCRLWFELANARNMHPTAEELAEHAAHFDAFGFVQLPLLTPQEVEKFTAAFEAGMRAARGGAADPDLVQDAATGYSKQRQQVVPFFDFQPEELYPLLDHPAVNDVFDALMGQGWILTLTEGTVPFSSLSLAC